MAALVILLLLHTSPTNALSGSQFHPGRISDDGVFFQGSTMSVDEIQAFLDAKVPSCDTNGVQPYAGTTRAAYSSARGYPPPFICLKDYVQDTPAQVAESGLCSAISARSGTSSAQIIHTVAQACGINPKVLLVLLQKEQILVTDDWPWPIQYRSATGFGCPDTAPCETQYYGFFNQVFLAARQYKRYARDADLYNHVAGRTNSVRFSPNSSCGSSNVFIENQATAGLYNYTPYQPNAAALANLYGTGDGCSAYGNRNFWRMFNDWFGPTVGPLVRTESSGELFYSNGAERFRVGSMQMAAEYGLGLSDVRFISQQEMDSLSLGQNGFSDQLHYIVKSNDDSDEDGGAIYLISRGRQIPITSMTQFNNFGFSISEIRYLPLSLIRSLPSAPHALSTYVQAPQNTIYKIESGKRRTIFEYNTYLSQNPGGAFSPLSDLILQRFAYGTPIIDGDAIISQPNGQIKLYQDGVAFNISTLDVYNCWNFSSLKKFTVGSFGEIGSTTGNTQLSCFTTSGDGKTYLMNGATKYLVPASWGIASPSSVLARTINRIPTGTTRQVIRKPNGALSVVEDGKKRPITSMGIFSKLGFTESDLLSVNNTTYDSLPLGAKKHHIGAVLVEPSKAVWIVTSNSQRKRIASLKDFLALGLQGQPNYKVSATDIAAYTAADSFPLTLKTNGIPALINSGFMHSLPTTTLQSAFGVSSSGLNDIDPKVTEHLPARAASRFVRSYGNAAVYYMENGTKRPFTTWQQVVNAGGSNSVLFLSDEFINSVPTGPSM